MSRKKRTTEKSGAPLGATIVPDRVFATVCFGLPEIGNPPAEGMILEIKRGIVFLEGTAVSRAPDDELDGRWLIDKVEVRSDHMELTLAQLFDNEITDKKMGTTIFSWGHDSHGKN